MRAGKTYDATPLGVRFEIVENTNGARFVVDVVGVPRGFLARANVHPGNAETLEVLEGRLGVTLGRRKHILGPGDTLTVPAGRRHRQYSPDGSPSRVRITATPAGATGRFVERVAEMSVRGELSERGYPKPMAAMRLVDELADAGHGASPPLAVQRGMAWVALRFAGRR